MNIFTTVSKRRRIESMVKKAIDAAALEAILDSKSDIGILSVVGSFIDLWPAKYFDTADDRKIAGLVLAYMMEISEIHVEDINEHGWALLKFTAEADSKDFQRNTPRTFEYLASRNLLGNAARKPNRTDH